MGPCKQVREATVEFVGRAEQEKIALEWRQAEGPCQQLQRRHGTRRCVLLALPCGRSRRARVLVADMTRQPRLQPPQRRREVARIHGLPCRGFVHLSCAFCEATKVGGVVERSTSWLSTPSMRKRIQKSPATALAMVNVSASVCAPCAAAGISVLPSSKATRCPGRTSGAHLNSMVAMPCTIWAWIGSGEVICGATASGTSLLVRSGWPALVTTAATV